MLFSLFLISGFIIHSIALPSSPAPLPTPLQGISVPVKDIQVQEKLIQEQFKKAADIKHQTSKGLKYIYIQVIQLGEGEGF